MVLGNCLQICTAHNLLGNIATSTLVAVIFNGETRAQSVLHWSGLKYARKNSNDRLMVSRRRLRIPLEFSGSTSEGETFFQEWN